MSKRLRYRYTILIPDAISITIVGSAQKAPRVRDITCLCAVRTWLLGFPSLSITRESLLQQKLRIPRVPNSGVPRSGSFIPFNPPGNSFWTEDIFKLGLVRRNIQMKDQCLNSGSPAYPVLTHVSLENNWFIDRISWCQPFYRSLALSNYIKTVFSITSRPQIWCKRLALPNLQGFQSTSILLENNYRHFILLSVRITVLLSRGRRCLKLSRVTKSQAPPNSNFRCVETLSTWQGWGTHTRPSNATEQLRFCFSSWKGKCMSHSASVGRHEWQ